MTAISASKGKQIWAKHISVSPRDIEIKRDGSE